MLPGYAEGKLQKDTLIPTYTPTGEWQRDDLAHWKVAAEDPNVKCNWGRHTSTECTVCSGEGSEQGDSGNDTDFNEILTRVWTKTADKTNSDGKAFEQIKDNSKNKVGVRIVTKNISAGSFSDGKIPADGSVTYKITAPKAGDYQMIMCGRVDDASKKLSERGISISLNGSSVTIDFGNRDGGLNGTGDNEFVICPTIHLTGNEDTIVVACKYYRIAFAQDAWVTFAEH